MPQKQMQNQTCSNVFSRLGSWSRHVSKPYNESLGLETMGLGLGLVAKGLGLGLEMYGCWSWS